MGLIGNFDGDEAGTIDLVYGPKSYSSWGSITLRSNQSADVLSPVYGVMPYEDVVLEDVIEMDPPTAFGARISPVGDFNGDGRPDIVVGAGGGGFAVLVY